MTAASRVKPAQREIATAEDYAATFVHFKPGQKVLEDLCAKFHDREIHVAGGIEGQRETEKRAAQKNVLSFILRKAGQQIGGNDKDE